jgi:hypothetical protein
VIVGQGKMSATGGIMPRRGVGLRRDGEGDAEAGDGEYTCRGVSSYEPGKGMGKVDIKVTFSATS